MTAIKVTNKNLPELVDSIPKLTIADRCDRCGAQAYWAVMLHSDSQPIMFCLHHSYGVEAKIIEPYAVRDERDMLYVEESLNR